MSKFKKGSKVAWKSQSQGSWKRKTGMIVEVVPAGAPPPTSVVGCGLRRKMESYVVEVQPTPNSKPRFYWPRSEALTLVKE